jgi:hypothetical protein
MDNPSPPFHQEFPENPYPFPQPKKITPPSYPLPRTMNVTLVLGVRNLA